MSLANRIFRLRTSASLTQEQLSAALEVSHQAIQKWESGSSLPDLGNIMKLARYFGISVDHLLFDSNERIVEEMHAQKKLLPDYESTKGWTIYSSYLMTEHRQCMEEGLDLENYRELFSAVSKMPKGANKEAMADILFDIVQNAPRQKDYAYIEPSTLSSIRSLRKPHPLDKPLPDRDTLIAKLHGAWMGRICGCLLGKPVEGIRTDELIPLLKSSGNYPMHRYILSTDISDEMYDSYRFRLRGKCFADRVDGMPVDDDTNYVILAQKLLEKYGKEFTSDHVAATWIANQSANAYYTAEQIAYHNFMNGYRPPQSAVYKNPCREWIGAQIRGDYFGYINPGNPERAAEMAFRDATVSHVKNGIYGEMFVSAAIACAAVTDSIEDILLGGLAQIPASSRLYAAITGVIEGYHNGVSEADCFRSIHKRFDERNEHDWCHTIPNAMIVAAALLYGKGSFGRSICMAVETGFDTDCNGATVGSILGMRGGIGCIGSEWTAPVNDTLHTSVFGVGTVRISECATATMEHLLQEM